MTSFPSKIRASACQCQPFVAIDSPQLSGLTLRTPFVFYLFSLVSPQNPVTAQQQQVAATVPTKELKARVKRFSLGCRVWPATVQPTPLITIVAIFAPHERLAHHVHTPTCSHLQRWHHLSLYPFLPPVARPGVRQGDAGCVSGCPHSCGGASNFRRLHSHVGCHGPRLNGHVVGGRGVAEEEEEEEEKEEGRKQHPCITNRMSSLIAICNESAFASPTCSPNLVFAVLINSSIFFYINRERSRRLTSKAKAPKPDRGQDENKRKERKQSQKRGKGYQGSQTKEPQRG